jgi:hypothetical protein
MEEFRGQEDVKKLKNKCGVISALKKVSPGFPISDRRGVGIHFASSLILAKSVFSHLPEGAAIFTEVGDKSF